MSRFVSRGIGCRPTTRLALGVWRGSNKYPSIRSPPAALPVNSSSSFSHRIQFTSLFFSRHIQNTVAMDRVCEACKTIPPIVAEGYVKKGVDEKINGVNCYVAAPNPTPKSGIIFVYDIFGYFPQTLQGADIMALTDPGHVVIMPDYFNGQPLPIDIIPPNTEEKRTRLGSFFQNEAALPRTAETTTKVLAGVKEKFPENPVFLPSRTMRKTDDLVAFYPSLCWGGKTATLLAKDIGNGFVAAGQAHPVMIDASEYEGYPVPHLSLFSKDEDTAATQKIGEIVDALKNGSVHKTYPNDIHGWMGARGNLSNPAEAKSFEQGYTDVVEFFKKTLYVSIAYVDPFLMDLLTKFQNDRS
ncbi:hypothetical protein Dda_3545 [Drechslerella dactyloides]|uniref:Dienelactone hydrolase domain-containing protein n=1 Tax=Drechslerella dactyloides TaxID=74499 RepID=A0AAD6IZN3_DREDA|nr:hypothetical protein Dda_3545 [Drechslerella dactyloides]